MNTRQLLREVRIFLGRGDTDTAGYYAKILLEKLTKKGRVPMGWSGQRQELVAWCEKVVRGEAA